MTRESNRGATVEFSMPDDWHPIATAPIEEPVMLGHYYVDECDGYNGESRWLWQASGQIQRNGMIWSDFMDLDYERAGFRTATHWRKLDERGPE